MYELGGTMECCMGCHSCVLIFIGVSPLVALIYVSFMKRFPYRQGSFHRAACINAENCADPQCINLTQTIYQLTHSIGQWKRLPIYLSVSLSICLSVTLFLQCSQLSNLTLCTLVYITSPLAPPVSKIIKYSASFYNKRNERESFIFHDSH